MKNEIKHCFESFLNKAFLIVIFLFSSFSFANDGFLSETIQEKVVNGNVKDSDGAPLPGVAIYVKGTSIGTTTDFDGNYTIEVSDSAVLVFSSVGFKTQEITVTDKTVIDVVLQEDATVLDEVIVTGYASQKKSNLTGAVSSMKLSKVEDRPAANAASLLQGQMAGVQVSSFSNQPGEDNPQIRIRGIGTLNAGQEPLILVDGVQTSMSQIPSSDIESISVLKDAASASIYGVRAANGVVLVTTKRGRSAKPTVKINYSTAFQSALVEPELVDSWDYAFIQNLDLTEQGQDPLFSEAHIQAMRDGSEPDLWANTNWFDEMYRTASMNTLYASVSGSENKVRYMFSSEYLDQEGTMINTGMKRYNFRSNIDVKVSEKTTIGMNLFGNRRDVTETLNSASATGADEDLNYIIRRFSNPTVPVQYSSGDWGQVNGLFYEPGGTVGTIKNPVEFANRGHNQAEKYNFVGKIYADFNFFKNFHYKPNFSYAYNTTLSSRFTPTYESYDAYGDMIKESIHNKLHNYSYTSKRYQIENLFTYDLEVGENQTFGFLLGQSAQLFRSDWFSGQVEDFPNNEIYVLSAGINNKDVAGGAGELALSSFFGRVNYNYADKYLLEFNYRYDGTSRFHTDTRWGGFPSLSAGWVLSKEGFMQNLDAVSFLKLRGSWGQLGNQSVGTFYPYTQNIGTGQNYIWEDYIAPGVAVTSLANQDLGWETTTITDIGIDLNLFQNKIQIVADWFDKTSSDILVRLPIPETMGGVSAPFQNIGEVKNTGWELDVRYRDNFGEVEVFGGFILSQVKNEVIDYGGLETISNNRITKEGLPIRSYYAFEADGYYQTQDELDNAPQQFGSALRLGDVKLVDISGPDGVPDGKITADYDREVIGNSFPDLQYSFNLGANYKGFDLNMFFQGVSGIDRYMWYNTETSGTFTKSALDYWEEDNRNAYTARWGNLGNNTKYSSHWLKDASYLRLKDITIGYTIPANYVEKINMKNVRIYFSGLNLLTWTDVKDYDPEKLTGDDRNRDYPQSKVVSFGINLTF